MCTYNRTVVTTMLGNGLCQLKKWVPVDYEVDLPENTTIVDNSPPLYTTSATDISPDKDNQDNLENKEIPQQQVEKQTIGAAQRRLPSQNKNNSQQKNVAAAGQYKCDECGKMCFDRASLKKHMQIHGARQYVCTYEGCGKKFQDSSKLKRHFLTHTGEKNHVCTICNKVRLFFV